jgi:hypothetical protein
MSRPINSLTLVVRRQHLLMIIKNGIVNMPHHPITIRHPNTFAPNISMILRRFSWLPIFDMSEKKIPVLESKQTIRISDKRAGTPCV